MKNDQTRKRDRRFKRKEKKKFIEEVNKVTEGKEIFDKNIPLIDQIKNEMGEDEFKMLYQHKQSTEDLEIKPKQNTFKIRREKNLNKEAIINIEIENQNDNSNTKENLDFALPKEKFLNEEDKLRMLFPKANKISELYETFDEYEENLEIIDLIEKNKDDDNIDKEEEKQEVKYKDLEENIIFYEYE